MLTPNDSILYSRVGYSSLLFRNHADKWIILSERYLKFDFILTADFRFIRKLLLDGVLCLFFDEVIG
jgi:hypothetical protein